MPKPNLSLDDAAFAKLYADRIAPLLRAREAERQAAQAAYSDRRKWRIGGAIALGIAVMIPLQSFGAGVVAAAFAFLALEALFAKPLEAVTRAARNDTLAATAEAIGCSFKAEKFEPDAYKRLLKLNLLPESQRARFEDLFTGKHNGCAFEFCTAWLENRGHKGHWSPQFEGHLIRISVPKTFAGTTVLRRDEGNLYNWFESVRVMWSLKRVDLGNVELEKVFEMYTSDEAEARYLADFAFVTRLLEVERRYNGLNLRCAFEKGELLIAVERRRQVEPASQDTFFHRVMIYETHHKAGVPVTTQRADEIEAALAQEADPTGQTPRAGLDTIARARAITTDVTEVLHLINVMATT